DGLAVVGVDIGGATTDVFSVFRAPEAGDPEATVFNRTVSANLGMSYSVSNVMAEAGIENILRWVPFPVDEVELRNRIKNKMIRPTTIPQTLEDLVIEQAIAREALRLAFEQHKALAVGLKGVQTERTISDIMTQAQTGSTLVDLLDLGLLVGSGGVLSHAPRRAAGAGPVTRRVPFGEMALLPLPEEGSVSLTATPERGFDLGAGKGRALTAEVKGGVVGCVVDTRGRRPFELPHDRDERIAR